jgi:glycosyltransferase involved in cell wall biosynthesis
MTPRLRVAPDVEAVFSYGKYPRTAREVPVLWEQTFAPQLGIDRDQWRRHWQRAAAHPAAAATRVVTATDVSAEHFAELFPAHAGKIHVIPYFLAHARAIPLELLEAKSDTIQPLRLLFVGKEARRKGLDTLVDAWSLLTASVQRRVSVRVISAMLDGAIALPGEWEHARHVTDMTAAMEAAHVLVFPTKREAYGLVLVEGMGAGCMALTTSAILQRSIVGPNAGHFIDPRDPAALAAAITVLSADPAAVRAGMSAARARFLERHQPAVVGQQYADLMYAVAGRGTPAPARTP